jgi:tetratricopeptide (TPR) repeat protein
LILKAMVLAFWSFASMSLGAEANAELEHARALQKSGKLSEAHAIYDRLLAGPADQPLVSQLRLELSRIHLAEGRYQDAARESMEAAALGRSLGDRTLEGNAETVTGLARMYSGDYAASAEMLDDALRAAVETSDFSAEVTRLNNLGNVFFYQGRYADAMQRYKDAFKIVEAHRGDDWNSSRRQLTVANIAVLYQRLGQYRNALDAYLSMRASPSALPASERAQLLTNMGTLYRRLGDPVKALETYRAAQAIYRENQTQNGEISVLNNVGIAEVLDLHAPGEALRSFDEALRMAQLSHSKPLELQSRLYRGETLLQLNRQADAEQDFLTASSLADEVHAPEDKWKALYGLARVARIGSDAERAQRLLRESVGVIETIRSNVGSSTPRGGFLADKRQVYDMLIDLKIRAARPDAADLFRLMEQSRARSLKDQKGAGAATNIDAVRRLLPARTLFVEYWIGDDALAGVWIAANGSGVFSRTGIATLRGDLKAYSIGLSKAGSADSEGGSRLAEILLGGLRGPLSSGEYRRLVVVPDRELARIPFDVLPLTHARVLDRYSVAYLPTASFLHAAQGRRALIPFWKDMMLAFADPAPGTQGAADMPMPGGSSRLPGAVSEVRDVGMVLDGKNTEHVGADARKVYLRHASDYRVVHLATHAFIDPNDANLSYILFAPAQPSQTYDYLFLKEVSALNLRKVDLVTASACETQSGEFVEGEGVENFSQAFLSAGAKSVVSSLWPVGDRSSATLMTNFYRELSGGTQAGEALQRAKIAYLKSVHGSAASQPFYWAAFVLSGDSDVRLPYVITRTTAAAALLALVGIVLLAVQLVRK